MKVRSAGQLAVLVGVLLVTGCGHSLRTFQPGTLALMGSIGHGAVQRATPEEQRRCVAVWNRSDAGAPFDGESLQASVAMHDGHCLITVVYYGALFPCWEWHRTITCTEHGVGFEYLHYKFHLRPYKLTWNAALVRSGRIKLRNPWAQRLGLYGGT
jgi:hypothetical protein